MKYLIAIPFIFIILCEHNVILNDNDQPTDVESKLSIEEYGQPKPGTIPILFAPDYIRTEHRIHSSPTFSPNINEVYWSVFPLGSDINHKYETILFSQKLGNKWSTPKVASFSGKYTDGGPLFSPDGNKLYFYSKRPLNKDSNEETKGEIWFVNKYKNNWSTPQHIQLNFEGEKLFFSISDSNSIFFTSGHGYKGIGSGTVDIYFSRFINGSYKNPERLSSDINSAKYIESDPLISRDEKYIIFFSFETPKNIGQYDLFISYNLKKNKWTNPKNLGKNINKGYSRFPRFSPDGKYLFFVRQDGVYWVDSSIIYDYKN